MFSTKNNLIRHKQIHNVDRVRFNCNKCVKTFTRKSDLTLHEKKFHVQQDMIMLANNIMVPNMEAGSSTTVKSSSDIWGDDGYDLQLNDLMERIESESRGKVLYYF